MHGEIVVLHLYDVGESVKLAQVKNLIVSITTMPPEEDLLRKNTPMDIRLPPSFRVNVDQVSFPDNELFPLITNDVRFFEIGVIAFISRITCHDVDWTSIYKQYPNGIPVPVGEKSLIKWLEKRFLQVLDKIQPAISEKLFNIHPKYEQYTVFCISDIDVHSSIEDFINTHQRDITGFLIWDPHPERLSDAQIQDAFKNPFQYTTCDYAIFDYDRAVVIDLNREYLDVLFVAELANLELLELRTLDTLLDAALESVEFDIGQLHSQKFWRNRNLNQKSQQLEQYRTSFIWIQEEISNVSKFIGDFFLGQMFEHITSMYELHRWQDSIKRKMQFIHEIYEKTQDDRKERITYRLEFLMAVLFVVETFVLILEYFVPWFHL